MKKWVSFVLVFLFAVIALPVYADTDSANGHAYAYGQEDSILDKVSDWVATIGKSDQEKDQLVAERQMDRVMKRTKHAMAQGSHKASKAMKDFGKDLEKAFK